MLDKSLDLGAMSVIWRGCGAETGYMRHALDGVDGLGYL